MSHVKLSPEMLHKNKLDEVRESFYSQADSKSSMAIFSLSIPAIYFHMKTFHNCTSFAPVVWYFILSST